MERIKIAPRPGYMGELEKIGFVFHKEYWLENAYYRFSSKEVEELEQAINNCYQMYCNVAEACLYDEEKLDKYYSGLVRKKIDEADAAMKTA